MDRKLRELGVHPGSLSPLDRLAWVGSRGMGALCYAPEHPALGERGDSELDLDAMAKAAKLVLEGSPEVVIDELLRVGGSPGGARPKALVGRSEDGASLIHGEEDLPPGYVYWLVKFGAREDAPETGLIELAYADMARAAGIIMPETARFPSRVGPGYFGVKRFDREAGRRIHTHTICGLLNADHRIPSIGYEELLKATFILTRKKDDLYQMYARMVFNVFAHNRDDHTKNHCFMMDETGEWHLSPGYDISFAFGPGGEHSLDIAGEGLNPTEEHLLKVAERSNVPKDMAKRTIERARSVVNKWPIFAKKHEVPTKAVQEIGKILGVENVNDRNMSK